MYAEPDDYFFLKSNMQHPEQYRQELDVLASKIPAYEELKLFLDESPELDSSPAKITRVRFNDSLAPEFADFQEDELAKHLETTQSSDLFVIENVSSNVVKLLGSRYGVGHDFWLDHIANSSWFRLGDIERHLPALASIRLESRHMRHQFIGVRELKTTNPDHPLCDRIEPERGSTRVPRIAGALYPLERLSGRSQVVVPASERYPSLALTRQHLSMWFDASEGDTGWKTGTLPY
jgi:hypothetical protein